MKKRSIAGAFTLVTVCLISSELIGAILSDGPGQELPEVGSGTLVANFTCDPATMDLGPENDLLSWRAANNENLILVAEGSPSSNITFDPKELGGFGSLVVNALLR